eukprot:gene11538-15455_t
MFGKWNNDPKPPEKSPSTKDDSTPAPVPSKSFQGGFDPTALERGAKALRDIERSSNSKEALRLVAAQEITKQKEHEAERAKYKAYQEELAIKRIAEEEQSAARTLQRKEQQDKKTLDYSDELERKRMGEQMEARRQLQDEDRRKNEESMKRLEEVRRKTAEHEAKLRAEVEVAKVKAEAEGRILQERMNHDLILSKAREASIQFRETVLEGIKLSASTIGTGVQTFLTDKDRMLNAVGFVAGVSFVYFGGRQSVQIIGNRVEAVLGKPSLVRETSKFSAIQLAKNPFATIRNSFRFAKKNNFSDSLNGVVLEENQEGRLKRIAFSAANTKKNKAPFRHLLFYGPPGNGKTMFAKGLAKECGMDYAIITGGDIAPLGKDGPVEIHKIFDWAERSSRGLLLFVDEADAFLRKRSSEKISEDMRNSLNAFLYRTGEASNKFMIVFASNQPEQFDWAINDRIDDMIEFTLPSKLERIRMLILYIDKYLTYTPSGAKTITVGDVTEDLIDFIADQTEGFSGREMSKLAIAWQAAAYGTENAIIDEKIFKQVLLEAKESKRQKLKWMNKEDADKLTSDSRI